MGSVFLGHPVDKHHDRIKKFDVKCLAVLLESKKIDLIQHISVLLLFKKLKNVQCQEEKKNFQPDSNILAFSKL